MEEVSKRDAEIRAQVEIRAGPSRTRKGKWELQIELKEVSE
jgi:hypothetical protein